MCRKKVEDIMIIEFLDHCKDGVLDLVKETLNNANDKLYLLKATDDEKKQPIHMVS